MPTYAGLHTYIASAGSGKTQTLAQAVVDSVLREPHKGVLAVTFTVKAAGELRQRILRLIKEQSPGLLKPLILGQLLLETSTLDSLIRGLFLHLAPFLMLPAEERLIVEEPDWLRFETEILTLLWHEVLANRSLRRDLVSRLHGDQYEHLPNYKRIFLQQVREVIAQGPIRTSIEKALAHPSALEDPFVTRAQLDFTKATQELITPALLTLIEDLVIAYRQRHQTLFLSDIQYIMELAAQNLPLHVAYPYRHYGHILVDEAQDTSPTQWRILTPLMKEILEGQGRVTLLGDPKQAIYAWREADPTHLLTWAQLGLVHPLSINYRNHRRLVAFNNGLYARLQAAFARCLSLKSRASKADKQRYARQRAALAHISEIYKGHRQKPARRHRPAKRGRRPLIRLRGYTQEVYLAQSLQRALKLLQRRGVPPKETAFLVRRNEDMPWLNRLLPGYNLQLTAKKLGEVPSIQALFRFLSAGQSDQAAYMYLRSTGLPLDTWKQALAQAETPIQYWEHFRLLAEAILQVQRGEKLFWETLLDRLWSFWGETGVISISQTIAWWETYGQKVSIEVPILNDTYPVLTIHKAKGLAWEAVILPKVDWALFEYTSRKRRWYPVDNIEAYLADYLRILLDIRPDVRCTLELPFKVASSDDRLASLYEMDYQAAVLENLNLHYVATTRPRSVLLIYYPIPKKPKETLPESWEEAWHLMRETYV